MVLIKSISGIRGTLGDNEGHDLTDKDVVKFVSSYANILKSESNKNLVLVGRDARKSGARFNKIVVKTLIDFGIDVLDINLTTTPTIEVAIVLKKAQGGIMISASHNDNKWNALKFFNSKGEFISKEKGEKILELYKNDSFCTSNNGKGQYYREDFIKKHIDAIKNLDLVDVQKIKSKNYKIVVDGINSTGGLAVPMLLEEIGVKNILKINCNPDGNFAHNPEPLSKNLKQLRDHVLSSKADLGIAVDPDVDRLAIVSNDGSFFGEEYTLVSCADYILSQQLGPTVSNLSSSKSLKELTEKYNCKYYYSAVGEVNVVEKMKEVGAVIGGEGNGGVIYPDLHYGRDALVGIALFLSLLSNKDKTTSELRKEYPFYCMIKDKVSLFEDFKIDDVFNKLKNIYSNANIINIDGLKIEFDKEWLHLRKSNTEPIIRIYAEGNDEIKLRKLIDETKNIINE